jgi:hypothetical protein
MGKTISARGVNTFINPAGIVEQHYIGRVTSSSVLKAVSDLRKFAKQIRDENKPALYLADVTKVTSHTLSSHKTALLNMEESPYDRSAVYGKLPLQILLNTLFMVSGKFDRSRAFSNRIDAIRWLKQ